MRANPAATLAIHLLALSAQQREAWDPYQRVCSGQIELGFGPLARRLVRVQVGPTIYPSLVLGSGNFYRDES